MVKTNLPPKHGAERMCYKGSEIFAALVCPVVLLLSEIIVIKVRKLYGCHHELVDHYGISVS